MLSGWHCTVALGKSLRFTRPKFPFYKKRCQECFERMYKRLNISNSYIGINFCCRLCLLCLWKLCWKSLEIIRVFCYVGRLKTNEKVGDRRRGR